MQYFMSNTYTKIHLQLVFAVKFRDGLIQEPWKDELYKYITGIIQNHNHKVLIINGMPDHIHILIGYRPTQALPDLLQDIKGDSSKWINSKNLIKGKFQWQEGYGAFSYSTSQLPEVINYIKNQEEHHKKKTFLEEYEEFLKKFNVEYEQKYIFKEPI